jgi:CRP/FNR family transcriptional regulator, cyclic AMP receptor protein
MMQTQTEMIIEREPLAARVALHPFLAGMNRTQLGLLTDCAMATHFETGEIILHQGEFANRFYLIEGGKVVLESNVGFGEPVVIETIGPGDLLGWSWMFPPYVWQFSARTVEPTTAIFFYGTILREYCEKDHSLGYELFKRMSPIILRRLQAARKKMLDVHASKTPLQSLALKSPSINPNSVPRQRGGRPRETSGHNVVRKKR